MDLPSLDWQFFYGRLAWTIVAASAVAALLPAAWRRNPAAICALLLSSAVLMALPQGASPAYWLILAFQWPSGVLLGCCLLALSKAWPGMRPVTPMPTRLAAVIGLAGTVLYLDAVGLLSLELYSWGFGPYLAPLLALTGGAACALAAVLGRARAHALVALGAVALFSLLRLPTGNLWDALLDPLLWGWAVGSLGIKGVLWVARGVRSARQSTGKVSGAVASNAFNNKE